MAQAPNPSEGDTKYTLNLETYLTSKEIEIIKELSEQLPQTIEKFKELMIEDFITFCKKQYDYGPGNIAVGTRLQNEKEIMVSLKGLWFRVSDKINRLFNIILMRDSIETANESVEDAWRDMSVYGMIARIVMDHKWTK